MKIDAIDNDPKQLPQSKPFDLKSGAGPVVAREAIENRDQTPSQDRILYNRLEGANAQSHDLARNIRAVDSTIQEIGDNVRQMHTLLEGIAKGYPPFPVDSAERIQSLRQFSSIRKMIDQLTVPPPEESPGMILGNPNTFPQAGDWEMNMPDGDPITLHRQPMHTGPSGLDIPELPVNASDEQIRTTLDKTAAAQRTIDRRRRAFVAEANRVIAALS